MSDQSTLFPMPAPRMNGPKDGGHHGALTLQMQYMNRREQERIEQREMEKRFVGMLMEVDEVSRYDIMEASLTKLIIMCRELAATHQVVNGKSVYKDIEAIERDILPALATIKMIRDKHKLAQTLFDEAGPDHRSDVQANRIWGLEVPELLNNLF